MLNLCLKKHLCIEKNEITHPEVPRNGDFSRLKVGDNSSETAKNAWQVDAEQNPHVHRRILLTTHQFTHNSRILSSIQVRNGHLSSPTPNTAQYQG